MIPVNVPTCPGNFRCTKLEACYAVWGTGVVYSPPADTSLQDIACLWRTSRKSLSSVNPDLVEDDLVKAHHPVCIVACSSTSVDPQCLEPKLAQ
jgi:hypothetical protein